MRSLLLATLLAATSVAAETNYGPVTFAERCAGCHGVDGQGHGPMADLLVVPVPDLTRIAERAGGSFPLIEVLSIVDGRAPLRGHGDPMPIFGGLLKGEAAVVDGPDGTIFQTDQGILEIVRHLEALQQ